MTASRRSGTLGARIAILALALVLAGCGSASTPDAEAVTQWPAKWCSIAPGVSRDALVDHMGAPTSESAESASWDAFGWQLNAFFDESGNVRQMDINEHGLSATQRAKITCPATRIAE